MKRGEIEGWKAWWKEGQRLNRGMKFTIIHHEFHNENHYEFHHKLTIHYEWNSLWNEYQLDLKWIWIILNEYELNKYELNMNYIKWIWIE